jgi:hypothetical protein
MIQKKRANRVSLPLESNKKSRNSRFSEHVSSSSTLLAPYKQNVKHSLSNSLHIFLSFSPKKLSIFFAIIFLMFLSAQSVFGSEQVVNSYFNSGDSFTFLGKTYTVGVTNAQVQIRSDDSGVIISKNQTKVYNNLRITVEDILPQIQNAKTVYRAKMRVETDEPTLNVTFSELKGFVGEYQTFKVVASQTGADNLIHSFELIIPANVFVSSFQGGCVYNSSSRKLIWVVQLSSQEKSCEFKYGANSLVNQTVSIKHEYQTSLRRIETFNKIPILLDFPISIEIKSPDSENQTLIVNRSQRFNLTTTLSPNAGVVGNMTPVEVTLIPSLPSSFQIHTDNFSKQSSPNYPIGRFANFEFTGVNKSTYSLTLSNSEFGTYTYAILANVSAEIPYILRQNVTIVVTDPNLVARSHNLNLNPTLAQILANTSDYFDVTLSVQNATTFENTSTIIAGLPNRYAVDIIPLCSCVLDDVQITVQMDSGNTSNRQDVIQKFEVERAQGFETIFMKRFLYTYANVSRDTNKSITLSAQFFINGTYANFTKKLPLDLKAPAEPSIRKEISKTSLESGEEFNVSVYVTGNELGQALVFNITEIIPNNVVAFGVTSRSLTIPANQEVLAYSYRAFAPNVQEKNSFELKTNFEYHIQGLPKKSNTTSAKLEVSHPKHLILTSRPTRVMTGEVFELGFDISHEFAYEIYDLKITPQSLGAGAYPRINFPSIESASISSLKPNETASSAVTFLSYRPGNPSRFVVRVEYQTKDNITIFRNYDLNATVILDPTNQELLGVSGAVINRTIYKQNNANVNQSYALTGFGNFTVEFQKNRFENISLDNASIHNVVELGSVLTNVWLLVNGKRFIVPQVSTDVNMTQSSQDQVNQSSTGLVSSNIESSLDPLNLQGLESNTLQVAYIAPREPLDSRTITIIVCVILLFCLLGAYGYIKYKENAQLNEPTPKATTVVQKKPDALLSKQTVSKQETLAKTNSPIQQPTIQKIATAQSPIPHTITDIAKQSKLLQIKEQLAQLKGTSQNLQSPVKPSLVLNVKSKLENSRNVLNELRKTKL